MTNQHHARLRPAVEGDLAQVERLLTSAGLPTAGVNEHLCNFIVADRAGALVGVVGLEVHGNYALLRSAAVAGDCRGGGLGRQLVEQIMAEAEARGIRALYLLTTTAERYFPRFGFVRSSRAEVPAELTASEEFRGACPQSATVMIRCLREEAATA